VKRAERWRLDADPLMRQLAAWSFAVNWTVSADLAPLARAFADADRGVRVMAVRGLKDKKVNGFLSEQLASLRTASPAGFVCIRCGTQNPADRTSCIECNLVGPDVARELDMLLASTSGTGDDEDERPTFEVARW